MNGTTNNNLHQSQQLNYTSQRIHTDSSKDNLLLSKHSNLSKNEKDIQMQLLLNRNLHINEM